MLKICLKQCDAATIVKGPSFGSLPVGSGINVILMILSI